MKFIIQWSTRPAGDAEDMIENSESLIKAFGTWTPPESWTITEFLTRVDGRGGMLITETDDLASISQTVGRYVAWLDYDVIPVTNVADGVADIVAGSAWARSAGGID